eukprot:gene19919-21871_t
MEISPVGYASTKEILRPEPMTLEYEITKKSKKQGKYRKSKKIRPDTDRNNTVHRNFISKPEKQILYKKILSGFISWMVWQKKILLCGLTGKCSRSFLQTLSTVFEPILHEKNTRVSLSLSSSLTQSIMMNKGDIEMQDDGGFVFEMDMLMHGVKASVQHDSSDPQDMYDAVNTRQGRESSFLPQIPNRPYTIGNSTTGTLKHNWPINHVHENANLSPAKRANAFFPKIMTSRTDKLGRICSVNAIVSCKAGTSDYNTRAFKNRKWWAQSSADHSLFAAPKGRLLMKGFRDRLDIIYKWFSEWYDAEKGDFILHVISSCELEELEYFSQCILQRLKDIADIDRLQDGLLLKIFKYLGTDDLLSVSEVSRRWHLLATNSMMWKEKCRKLGDENELPDIVEQMKAASNGTEINWKLAYRDLLSSLRYWKSRLENERMIQENKQQGTDDERSTAPSSDDEEDDYEDEEDSESTASDYTSAEEEEVFGDDEEDGSTGFSSVSGMSDYLNGDLRMIEDTVQQLSAKAKLNEAAEQEEDSVLDIRPEASVQARNQLIASAIAQSDATDTSFKFVNVDGIRALKRVRRLQGHIEAVLALQFDKKRVMSGSADRTIRVWDVRSGRSVRKLKGQKGGIRAIRFDNRHIITASWDMTIVVWHAVKFKRIKTLHGHQDCVSCLEITEDNLFSGSHDKTLKIWCRDSWKCLGTLKGHQGGITCLTLIGDEEMLSGSSDRTIRLWSLASYTCQKVFRGSQDVILTVQTCGDLLAAGSNDGKLIFWDMKSGRCEATIVAHKGPLHGLSFCGSRFVTGGGDQLVKEWDLATCCCLRSLTGHKDVVLCVQASPRRIVSGSADGTVRVWEMESRIRT